MNDLANPLLGIIESKHNGSLRYHSYGLKRMMERNIRAQQVIEALNSSQVEILENHPQIGRPSADCLILGKDGDGNYLHVLVAFPIYEVLNVYKPSMPWFINERERNRNKK